MATHIIKRRARNRNGGSDIGAGYTGFIWTEATGMLDFGEFLRGGL